MVLTVPALRNHIVDVAVSVVPCLSRLLFVLLSKQDGRILCALVVLLSCRTLLLFRELTCFHGCSVFLESS